MCEWRQIGFSTGEEGCQWNLSCVGHNEQIRVVLYCYQLLTIHGWSCEIVQRRCYEPANPEGKDVLYSDDALNGQN